MAFFSKLFKKKQQLVVREPAVQEPVVDTPRSEAQTDSRKIFLNAGASHFGESEPETQVTVLGSTVGVKKSDQRIVQTLKNGHTMTMNIDGTYIVRDTDGLIVKTCDVLRCKREFMRDPETQELMIKRFSVWITPENGRLDDAGTFFYTNHNMDVEERLNGLHVHTNRDSGMVIQTHHHNNFEIIKLPGQEIWKRESSTEQETFVIWKNGKLTFKSQTFYSPKSAFTRTPNGPQPLNQVSRKEESWENGLLAREKFSFKDSTGKGRAVNVQLQLSSGILVLKQVTTITSNFKDGLPNETVYELKNPMNLTVDIPNMKRVVENIIRVRNFEAGVNLGLSLVTTTNDEYIVFVGVRSLETRKQAGQVADERDAAYAEGEEVADLMLR